MFTTDPEQLDYIKNDPLKLHTASAAFFMQSTRMDRLVAKKDDAKHPPMLVFLAGKDRIIDNEATRELVTRDPNRSVKIIDYPDQTHSIQLDAPERMTSDIIRWIDALPEHLTEHSRGCPRTMPRVTSYELHAVELPFRGKFEHAAHSRETSSSLFLRTHPRRRHPWLGRSSASPLRHRRNTRRRLRTAAPNRSCRNCSARSFEELRRTDRVSARLRWHRTRRLGVTRNPAVAPPGVRSTSRLLDAFGRHFGKCAPFGLPRHLNSPRVSATAAC